MSSTYSNIVRFIAVALTAVTMASANAGFTSFVIRDGATSSPDILPNTDYVPDGIEFVTSEGGQKAALGSNDMNGQMIGDIENLTITRHDDTTRFTAGSGPAVAPYFNLWVTDGGGNYAVIANEPSNGAFQPLFETNGDGSKSYDLSYSDLSGHVAKVYETPGAAAGTSWVHTLVGSSSLTFSDIASLVIEAPSAAYISNVANAVGTGAPKVLGTDQAYGVNWVFGDTLSNYVSGDEGYVVSGASVPEPSSIALCGLAVMAGIAGYRRRRTA